MCNAIYAAAALTALVVGLTVLRIKEGRSPNAELLAHLLEQTGTAHPLRLRPKSRLPLDHAQGRRILLLNGTSSTGPKPGQFRTHQTALHHRLIQPKSHGLSLPWDNPPHLLSTSYFFVIPAFTIHDIYV